MFVYTETPIHEMEVLKFYENLTVLEGNVATSQVYELEIVFDKLKLGEILRIPSMGLME